jgi:hypothetical protein
VVLAALGCVPTAPLLRACGLVVACLGAMAETTPAADRHPVRELPSFAGVADSRDGSLSVKVDEILYGEPPAPDAAA